MTAPRIFKDSTRPQLIPTAGTDGVLVYYNGKYAWQVPDVNRFLNAGKQVRHIDVIGNAWHRCAILDVERFDATVETAKTWIPQRDHMFNNDATVYIERSGLTELFDTCRGAPYWLIVADWTGAPHTLSDITLPKGVRIAGVQYNTIPNVYDVSAIYAPDWYPVRKAA